VPVLFPDQVVHQPAQALVQAQTQLQAQSPQLLLAPLQPVKLRLLHLLVLVPVQELVPLPRVQVVLPLVLIRVLTQLLKLVQTALPPALVQVLEQVQKQEWSLQPVLPVQHLLQPV